MEDVGPKGDSTDGSGTDSSIIIAAECGHFLVVDSSTCVVPHSGWISNVRKREESKKELGGK